MEMLRKAFRFLNYAKSRFNKSRRHFQEIVSLSSVGAFQAGERVAKLSVITLVSIGLVELIVGFWTGSLGIKADGVDSISDCVISLIVWVGLHYSRRRPDARFHFGYQKVESLSSLMASIGMVGVASYIMFHSYLTFLNPKPIAYPYIALATLLACGTVSLYRALQMRSVAKKYALLSLRTDANNSIKDGTATVVVFVSILGASIGFYELDALAGIIIAFYILGVAYIAFKEASLVLLDACESPELTSGLATAIKTVEGVHDVTSIRLRLSGPYLTGIISVLVDSSRTVGDTESLRKKILEVVSAVV